MSLVIFACNIAHTPFHIIARFDFFFLVKLFKFDYLMLYVTKKKKIEVL